MKEIGDILAPTNHVSIYYSPNNFAMKNGTN